MTDEHEPTPAEIDAGRDALRELADLEPLPPDVLTRLEGRLAAEPGMRAPARRARRRRRLTFAIPGVAVALAASVFVVGIVTRESSSAPKASPALSSLAKSRAMVPKATAGVAAGSNGVALARVPALVGHSVRDAGALATRHGLRVDARTASCRPKPTARVSGQTPRAGAMLTPGSTIRLATRACRAAGP